MLHKIVYFLHVFGAKLYVRFLAITYSVLRHVYGLFKTSSTQTCFNYTINAQFLYSITIYTLHYNHRHVSSSTMLIFRRTNCIITASGIVTLEISELTYFRSDDTRCCDNTICPPEDGHVNARNMSRIVM